MRSAYRPLLLAGVALAGPAVAQTTGTAPTVGSAQATEAQGAQPAPTVETAASASTPAAGGADIVVTGSRIARPDFAAPSPIVSLNAVNIQQSGNTNITEFLRRVPALTNSLDASRTAGNAQADGAIGQIGLNRLDLRGLGPDRTLVLVNGRRHVAGQFDTAAVDVNSIPTDLIERVDVLTGAASAIYGADGVSGVVNFVLKRDFDGIAARSQFGISQRGDAANRFASIIAGRNFADGRANVTIAYEYNADQPLANDDRGYLRGANRRYFVNVDNYDPTRAGSYQQGPVNDLRYLPTYTLDDGTIVAGGSNQGIVAINNVLFRGDGQLYTPGRALANDGFSTGGDDAPVAGYIGDLLPRTRRHAANLLTRFEASDALKLSFEGKFVQSTVTSFSGYNGNYPATISLDNPFIPQTIRNAAVAAGLTSVDVARNNFDLPRRGEEDRRRTWRAVADATGRLTDHASYDIYYTFGRTDLRATKLNDRLADRFAAALDVVTDPRTGQPVCRSNLVPGSIDAFSFTPGPNSGCVPVNTFGSNTVNPASFDFYLSDPVSRARVTQHVVNASLTGDFGQFFELPGGPVQFAVGGEYRRESSRFRPADDLVNNRFYQFDEYVIPTPSSGRFDVWEAFGELNVPILKDVPFASLLSVGAAGRYSDYSTVGSTRTYQFNGVYAPVRDVSFRGSYGRSVRAPNIAELFRPSTGFSDFLTDPCYVPNRSRGTQFREANCRTLIQAAGGNPANFLAANNPNAAVNLVGVQQGNPDLKAETARTWTAGLVLRPQFVPNLQIAADWYDIRLRDAISQASPTTVAELCVDQPTVDNPFCRTVSRQAGTGYVSGFIVQPENVAAFRTAGLEVNVSYLLRTAAAGTFDLRLVGGYLDRLEQIATPGAVTENNVDQIFRPRYIVTFSPTWTKGALTLNYTLRYQNGTRRFARIDTDRNPTLVDPRYLRYKELWSHDVQAQLAVDERFSLYGGVNNLIDQKPGFGNQTAVPISPLGRYVYAGAKVRLAR